MLGSVRPGLHVDDRANRCAALGAVVTDASDAFSTEVTIPAGIEAGQHCIVVTAETAQPAFTVSAGGTATAVLANTGVNSLAAMLGGALAQGPPEPVHFILRRQRGKPTAPPLVEHVETA